MGWLKDRLFGGRRRMPTPGGLCDSCNADLDPATAGYYLTTRDVVLSELYWANAFKVQKHMADMFDMAEPQLMTMFDGMLRSMAGQSHPWGICEECSELFFFDRDKARSHAAANTAPAGSGPVDPSGCVLFAALGWERAFGSWPAAVKRPAVTGSCDLCDKAMYDGEMSHTVPPERMAHFRAEGFVDRDPVRDARPDGGWRICQPCTSSILARSDRAGRRPDTAG